MLESMHPIGKMVKIVKLHEDAVIPFYAHKGDAGADLHSVESLELSPGQYRLISTGIAIAMPAGWVGLVHPRSGLAAKYGVTIVNAPGTVDSEYRGEIKVNLINLGTTTVSINVGDRIAQIVFQRYEQADFFEVTDLDITARGSAGFGSTGGFENGPLQG
jgi:dUTP pyrophosphatase